MTGDILDVVVSAPDSQKESLIAMLANMVGNDGRPLGAEKVRAALVERAEKVRAKREATAAKLAREARDARLSALRATVEGFSLETLDIAAVRSAIEAARSDNSRVVVVTSGDGLAFSIDTGSVSVANPGASGGNGGKPARDEPRPFTDSSGVRIVGAIPDWVRSNFDDATIATFPHKDGKLLGGKRLADFLVKKGFLKVSPL